MPGVVVIAAVALFAGTPQVAAQSSRTGASSVHADWAGHYRMAHGKDLEGFTPLNVELDDVIKEHLRPWARMKMEATNGVADDTGAVCQLSGIFRVPTTVGSFLWLPSPSKIVVAFDGISTAGVRRIYLNRSHLERLPHTWLGDSVGRWDGDTLLIDTVGFNDQSWLMSGMEPHTEELHVVERVRSVAGGMLLEIQSTVEDRKAFTSPYSFSRYYRRTDLDLHENVCNGDVGEQELWMGFRKHALETGFEPPRTK